MRKTRIIEHVFEDEARDEQLVRLRELEVTCARVFADQCAALLALWDDTPEDWSGSAGTRTCSRRPAWRSACTRRPSARASGSRSRCGRTPCWTCWPRSGGLGVPHALAAADEADALGDDDLVSRVLHDVLTAEGRIGWPGTPAELPTALRRRAVALDPAAAARRRAAELAARTGLRLRPLPDGLAALVGTGEAEQITAASRLVDALARPAGPDDDRSAGQRQIDALLGALVARAGTGVAVELQLEIPVATSCAPARTNEGLPEADRGPGRPHSRAARRAAGHSSRRRCPGRAGAGVPRPASPAAPGRPGAARARTARPAATRRAAR